MATVSTLTLQQCVLDQPEKQGQVPRLDLKDTWSAWDSCDNEGPKAGG